MNKSGLSINIQGYLMTFESPKVMGILNVTPDSFYDGGRYIDENSLEARIDQLIEEEADIIDIGGCSTRPGSSSANEQEEWNRVSAALQIIRDKGIEIPLSIDTFRAGIARRAVEDFRVAIINDISGGRFDTDMWRTVAELNVPYILTHNRSTPDKMQEQALYQNVTAEVLTELSIQVNELHRLGVNDVIIDPGFGFAKTPSQNLKLLSDLEEFCKMGMPVLTGMSRKSMVCGPLNCTPEESLAGTLVIETIALLKGVDILRVHDVKETRQAINLVEQIERSKIESIND